MRNPKNSFQIPHYNKLEEIPIERSTTSNYTESTYNIPHTPTLRDLLSVFWSKCNGVYLCL